jgi:DNA-binding NarL/FixJ family response regulator
MLKAITLNLMTRDSLALTCEDSANSCYCLDEFKNLFVIGEARFLLACLAKGFNPSFIIVCQSNIEIAMAFKSIRRTGDFLGAARSSSQAVDLLKKVKPGFIFIRERAGEGQYAHLAKYASQLSSPIRVFVLVDSLASVEGYDANDVDVFMADCDIFLPVNPLAQGLMAMIAGTAYRSPSVVNYINKLSIPVEPLSSRRICLSLRDQQLLEAYVLGLSNREVAEALNLSVHTIRAYSGQLLARLGVNNRQKALLRVAQMGISVIPKFFRN